MSEKPDSPSPSQYQAMKQATAFGYGYTQTMYQAQPTQDRLLRLENFEHDLRYFGCYEENSRSLKAIYQPFFEAGCSKALENLQGIDS